VYRRPFPLGSRDLGRQQPNHARVEGGVGIIEQLVKQLKPTTMIDVHACTFAIIGPNRIPLDVLAKVVEERASQDGSLRLASQRLAVCPAQPRPPTEDFVPLSLKAVRLRTVRAAP
jgi:hypothetical protein